MWRLRKRFIVEYQRLADDIFQRAFWRPADRLTKREAVKLRKTGAKLK
ncbi:hypothetical protein SEEGA711_03508 [Salmonella enterica subsp. enterica serovar Gaminara str. ATCC BAA-711]|nr:hypothetical protein SEEGA711_03508 [Salmonella enterica subsp. enterica serovar Gaminara str. ATCC BAA-711]